MYVDLYLPTMTWKTIRYFSKDYSAVINYILKLSSESGIFDISDKPPAPPLKSTKYSHKKVFITDEAFIAFADKYHNSSKCSLRRLVFWFFDNEMTYLFYDSNGNLPQSFSHTEDLSSETTRYDKIHKNLDILHKTLKKLHCLVANDIEKVYYESIKDAVDKFANQFADK